MKPHEMVDLSHMGIEPAKMAVLASRPVVYP